MTLWLPRGHRSRAEIEIKRSRFITTLARVDSEAEARDVIAEVRGTWPDARHHCTAFIVEVEDAQPVERSSDDGEPSGTAGRPMLDVLRGADVRQVVAVVTRYFGGVKLGTGGLVRAYSDAVALALEEAPRVRPVVSDIVEATFTYADAARVTDALTAAGLAVVDSVYGTEVTLHVAGDRPTIAGIAAGIVHGDVEVRPRGRLVVEEPVTA